MTIRTVVALASRLWLLAAGLVVTGEAQERRFETVEVPNAEDVAYGVNLPRDFDPNRAYPVLVGPVDGVVGTPPGFFWRDGIGEAQWIVVETRALFESNSRARTKALLGHLRAVYPVEGDRFHIVGWSASSRDVYGLVQVMPDEFASVTGIPGHPTTRDDAVLTGMKAVRVQMIVGERDDYWLRQARRGKSDLEDAGVTVSLDVVPDGGHVLTELRGKPFLDRMERLRRETNGQVSP